MVVITITSEQGLRAVLGLDANVGKDFKGDALAREALDDLLHGVELLDGAVGDDGDAPGAEVLEVHADLLRDAGAEADRRGRHLKGVLLERLGRLGGRRVAAVARPGRRPGQQRRLRVVVARVGVARARRRVRVLDGAEEAARAYGRLFFVGKDGHLISIIVHCGGSTHLEDVILHWAQLGRAQPL